jgi:hypothetical protein
MPLKKTNLTVHLSNQSYQAETTICWVNENERADDANVQGESQAGERENSETNGHEHTIVSSILTDLIIKRNNGRRAVLSGPPLNQ